MRAMLILILSVSCCEHFSAADTCELDDPCNFAEGDRLEINGTIPDGNLKKNGIIYFNDNKNQNITWKVTDEFERGAAHTTLATSMCKKKYIVSTVLSNFSYLSLDIRYESKVNDLSIALELKTAGTRYYICLPNPEVLELQVSRVTWEDVPFTCRTIKAPTPPVGQTKIPAWIVAASCPIGLFLVVLYIGLYRNCVQRRKPDEDQGITTENEIYGTGSATEIAKVTENEIYWLGNATRPVVPPSTVKPEEEDHPYDCIDQELLQQMHGQHLPRPR